MNYNSIGKLVAVFGLKGELVLQHNLGKKSALKGLDVLFVEEIKGEMLPYFIQSAKAKSPTEIYLSLEGINTPEKAARLRQKEVWLRQEDFHQHAAAGSLISLLGFHLIDAGNDLGPIEEIIEQPHQMLARISLEGKEALIPLHEQTLEKIDKKKKQVWVTLPEGLLDVYR
ncbi:MAG: 16S rRNA processing protein RimM [Bacteroidota bacterium]|nr:16S rRNA processing protein RimM [Bacteroidota bacterium]